MKIFPPADVFTPKQWLSIIGADLAASILWASHFIFEYNVIIKIELELYFLLICYFGVVLGGIFALKIIPKMDYYFAFILFLSLDILSLILLITMENPIIVIITLFATGFFGSSFTGLIFVQFSYALPDPKFNGRANGGGYVVINLLIALMILINSSKFPFENIIFLIFLYIIIILSTIIGKIDVKLPAQSSLRIRKYLFDKKKFSEIFMAFFWGFFLTIPFYSVYLIFDGENLQEFFNTFVLILFITFAISVFIAGQIYDMLGRKVGMLLGLGIQALSFLLIVILNDDYYLDYIFPIILGVGTTFFLTSIPLIFVESTPKKFIRDKMSLAYIFMGLGMIFAVVLAEHLKDEFLIDSYLTLYLLFMFLIAAIFISQIKETLPSKKELGWQGEMQYLFLTFKSGVSIYNQDLTKLGKKTDYHKDSEILLGGALVAVSSIFNEILRDKKIIKVIKQENYTIHIEEGKHVIMALIALHEIKKIRKKMQEFLDDFEDFFEDALVKGIAETQLFMPTRKIVQKYFFNYW